MYTSKKTCLAFSKYCLGDEDLKFRDTDKNFEEIMKLKKSVDMRKKGSSCCGKEPEEEFSIGKDPEANPRFQKRGQR